MVGAFIKAARLRTLPLAIGSIAMGAILSSYFYSHSWAITGLALLTAILLQVLSNFANDYGDFTKGTDDAIRTDRALASGQLTIAQMKIALVVTSIASLLSGIALLYVSFDTLSIPFLAFLLVGLVAIGAAIKYTAGKNPYGYKSWGDVSVFLFFGIVAVLGLYYLHTGEYNSDFWICLIPAISVGLLAAGVLNVNNIRDIHGDQANGKMTLAVKLGKVNAEYYQLLLYIIAIVLLFFFTRTVSESSGLIVLLLLPLYLFHWVALKRLTPDGSERNTYNKLLKLHVFMNLLVVILTALVLL